MANQSETDRFIVQCEEWLRSGRSGQVVTALNSLNIKSLSPTQRLPLAQLARRIQRPHLGLRILSPLIRPDREVNHRPPTPQELCEYGILLYQIGSVREGFSLLQTLSNQEVPDSLLYQSFCLIREWRNQEAQSYLSAYIASDRITEYQRSIAEVNLAAALVSTSDPHTSNFLGELEARFQEKNYLKLLANVLEMKAQWHLKQQNFEQTAACLQKARTLLEHDGTTDHFMIEKWTAVLQAERSQDLSGLRRFREKALARRHWESLRAADYHEIKITRDSKLRDYLYFGTPYSAFRNQILALQIPHSNSESYVLGQGDSDFDLTNGRLSSSSEPVFKRKLLQVLQVLFSDFYRTFQVGHLFSALFENENYDPYSSPYRIHQIVFRARTKLRQVAPALDILCERGTYRFILNRGLRISIPVNLKLQHWEEVQMAALMRAFGEQFFSALEGQRALQVSPTSFLRLVQFGLVSGQIEKRTFGKKTRYRVSQTETIGRRGGIQQAG